MINIVTSIITTFSRSFLIRVRSFTKIPLYNVQFSYDNIFLKRFPEGSKLLTI